MSRLDRKYELEILMKECQVNIERMATYPKDVVNPSMDMYINKIRGNLNAFELYYKEYLELNDKIKKA